MKPTLRIIVLVAIYLLYCITSFAQIEDSIDFRGRSEIVINDGLLSLSQISAIVEGGSTYSGLKDMSYNMTGAAFITYRYYLSNRFAIGLAAGLDNQKGDLSFGNPKLTGHSSIPGYHSGSYRRDIYTTAAEGLYIYRRHPRNMLYGFIGVGYTFGSINYSFNENGQKFFAQYRSDILPYSARISHFNVQVTALGLSQTFLKDRFRAFFELGIGYKGLVCAGVAVHLGQNKHIAR